MLPASTVLVLRAGAYSAFPSAEDLAAVPAAQAAVDPGLFPGDSAVHALGRQMMPWGWAVRLGGSTGDVEQAFWWLTIGLSFAVAMGSFTLMRGTGVPGLLIAPALLLGLYGPAANPLGLEYPTRFGTAFRIEWLALTLLLWSYGAFVRGRTIVTGLLLGLAALTHPIAALHGGLVLLVATSLSAEAPRRTRAGMLLVAATVAAYAVLETGIARVAGDAWLKEVYVYRLPERYQFAPLWPQGALISAIQLFAGLTGAALLRKGERSKAARALTGLLLGQAALAGAAVVCYGLEPLGAAGRPALPYIMDLTLTLPLLPVVAAVAALAPLETRVVTPREAGNRPLVASVALAIALVTLLALCGPSLRNLAVITLTLGALAVAHRSRNRRVLLDALAAAGVFLVGVGALGWAATHEIRTRARPGADELELYAWARRARPETALFIVPPSARGFRFYTGRGVYVDYGLFPATRPAAAREWRRRLERVAAPERRTLQSPPWRRVFMWDRDYANRNPPARIAALLGETGADYFVWDARGLDIPPFLTVDRPPDAGLIEVFRNARYVAYSRSGAADAVR